MATTKPKAAAEGTGTEAGGPVSETTTFAETTEVSEVP